MSFLAPKPDIPAPKAPERQSLEISGAVPVGFGRFRAGLKLFEAPFNHRHFNHGSRLPQGNVYTIVAGGIHGPVDRLYRVWINGKPIWQLAGTRQGEFFRDFSYSYANHTFRARVYWGDPGQPAAPFLNGVPAHGIQPPRNHNGSIRSHPPYAGIFYIIFYELHFDFPASTIGQATLPPIEAEVLVRPPNDEWVPDSKLHHAGVNPISAAREMLTNPIWGADLPESLLPEQPWTQKAWDLKVHGYDNLKEGDGNLSPVWGANTDLARALADLFSYYDGFLRVRDGKLLPGFFPNQYEEPGEVTTLERHDCVDEPDIDPEDWEDTLSEITVTFREVGDFLSETPITERSNYNRTVTDRGTRKSLDAPFIINSHAARRLGRRHLRRKGQPGLRARLKLLRGRAHNPDGSLLLPGDLCRFNHEPHALNVLCRVIERVDHGGEVTLLLHNEHGSHPEDYVSLPDPRERPVIDPPGTIENWRLFELPDILAQRPWPPKVAVLAQRPNPSVISATAHISETGQFGVDDQPIESIGMFAVPATLNAPATDQAESISFTLTGAGEDLGLHRDFTAAEQADGHVMALVGDELLSLGELIEAGGETTRVYGIRRGMFATFAQAHGEGTPMFLFRREWLERMTITHELFRWDEPYNAQNATLWLRLSANTGWETGDPNAPLSIVLKSRVPSVAFQSWPGSPDLPGSITEWSEFTVKGLAIAADSPLEAIYMQLVLLGQPERILHSWTIAANHPTLAQWEFRIPEGATLGHAGNCQIRVWVVDRRNVFVGGGLIEIAVTQAANATGHIDALPDPHTALKPLEITGAVQKGTFTLHWVVVRVERIADGALIWDQGIEITGNPQQSDWKAVVLNPLMPGLHKVTATVLDTRGMRGSHAIAQAQFNVEWGAPAQLSVNPTGSIKTHLPHKLSGSIHAGGYQSEWILVHVVRQIDQSVVAEEWVRAAGDPTPWSIGWTPLTEGQGAYQVRVHVHDGRGQQHAYTAGWQDLNVAAGAPAIVGFDPSPQMKPYLPVSLTGQVHAVDYETTWILVQIARQSDQAIVREQWIQPTEQPGGWAIEFIPETAGSNVYQARVYVYDSRGQQFGSLRGTKLLSVAQAPYGVQFHGSGASQAFVASSTRVKVVVNTRPDDHPYFLWLVWDHPLAPGESEHEGEVIHTGWSTTMDPQHEVVAAFTPARQGTGYLKVFIQRHGGTAQFAGGTSVYVGPEQRPSTTLWSEEHRPDGEEYYRSDAQFSLSNPGGPYWWGTNQIAVGNLTWQGRDRVVRSHSNASNGAHNWYWYASNMPSPMLSGRRYVISGWIYVQSNMTNVTDIRLTVGSTSISRIFAPTDSWVAFEIETGLLPSNATIVYFRHRSAQGEVFSGANSPEDDRFFLSDFLIRDVTDSMGWELVRTNDLWHALPNGTTQRPAYSYDLEFHQWRQIDEHISANRISAGVIDTDEIEIRSILRAGDATDIDTGAGLWWRGRVGPVMEQFRAGDPAGSHILVDGETGEVIIAAGSGEGRWSMLDGDVSQGSLWRQNYGSTFGGFPTLLTQWGNTGALTPALATLRASTDPGGYGVIDWEIAGDAYGTLFRVREYAYGGEHHVEIGDPGNPGQVEVLLHGNRIQDLPAPGAPNDAARKAYVDSAINGIYPVSNANLSTMAANRFKGRASGTGSPQDLSAWQVADILTSQVWGTGFYTNHISGHSASLDIDAGYIWANSMDVDQIRPSYGYWPPRVELNHHLFYRGNRVPNVEPSPEAATFLTLFIPVNHHAVAIVAYNRLLNGTTQGYRRVMFRIRRGASGSPVVTAPVNEVPEQGGTGITLSTTTTTTSVNFRVTDLWGGDTGTDKWWITITQ